MKKTLLTALTILLSVSIAAAQNSTDNNQESPRGGVRLEALGGMGLLTGKDGPGESVNRTTFHGSAAVSGVFKNNKHALGLLFLYRFNRLGTAELEGMDVNIDWHTMFIGPQYTWVSTPHKSSSFLMDIGMGGVILSEKASVGNLSSSVSLNGFGTNMGIGGRFSIGKQSFFVLKLSILSSILYPDWNYDEGLNASSVNISLGFSFGK